MFSYKKYAAYNDAIFDYFFNADRADQLTTLSFDDDAASQIGQEFSLSGQDFARELSIQIRSVVNLNEDDPYRFWSRHSQRESTALLASEVIIISRLGTNSSGALQHQGFHAAFNRDVLGINDSEHVVGLKILDDLWKRFERYLRIDEHGSLGRIAFLEVIKYKHINYPASQCFVRVSDRRRLHALFRRYFAPERSLDRSDLMSLFVEDTTGLSVMFRRAFEQLNEHPDLSRGFWSIVEGEYKVWQAEPAQVELIARSKASKATIAVRSPNAASASDLQPIRFETVASRSLVEESRPRIRVAVELAPLRVVHSRLTLVQPHRRAAELMLEVRVPVAGDAALEAAGVSHDGWVRIDGHVDADMFEEGFERFCEGFRIRRRGTVLAAFESGYRGWVETNVLKAGMPLRLVCSIAYAENLQQLQDVATDFEVVPTVESELACYALSLPLDIDVTTLPSVLQDALSGPQAKVAFSSGLRLRNGMYVPEGPPLVTYVHHTVASAEVFLDGILVGIAEREVAFRLPPTDRSGRHVVAILDQQRSFYASDAQVEDDAAAQSPESSLGVVTASHPPRLETNLDAEMLRIDELSRMSAVVVVGADVLLPYRRFAE